MMPFDLPSYDLLREQVDWLSPARSRLLRQVGVAHRKRILDLGCGFGVVTDELARRGGGMVVGVDHHFISRTARSGLPNPRVPAGFGNPAGAMIELLNFVCGDAGKLPFANSAFDLVFCQLALMWMPLEQTAAEIGRVMMKGGVVVAIEPDYGGMLEWPDGAGLKEIWISALTRAGADPFVGRKLPGVLARASFDVRVETTPGILPPRGSRFAFLRGLPLTPEEERRVAEVEKRSTADFSKWEALVHLPFVLMVGVKAGQ